MPNHLKIWIYVILAFAVCVSPANSIASQNKAEGKIERIGPEQTRQNVQSGKALLVCSYDDEKCKPLLLEGALLRSDFESKLSSLKKDQEIIFYCG
ncbi:hypothetical protein ACFL9T_04240 [Thermodesulfobacteriota bacterium]